MKISVLRVIPLALLLAASACRRDPRPKTPDTLPPPASSTPSAASVPKPSACSLPGTPSPSSALSLLPSPPSWFPSSSSAAALEILQTPASNLTGLYRSADNTLCATDHGAGFAGPAHPSSTAFR